MAPTASRITGQPNPRPPDQGGSADRLDWPWDVSRPPSPDHRPDGSCVDARGSSGRPKLNLGRGVPQPSSRSIGQAKLSAATGFVWPSEYEWSGWVSLGNVPPGPLEAR